jgi:hypothetical protein
MSVFFLPHGHEGLGRLSQCTLPILSLSVLEALTVAKRRPTLPTAALRTQSYLQLTCYS